jgi:hypothetical protein
LALANNCAFVDIYQRWGGGGNGNIANSRGYYGDGSVHPGNMGHQDIANAIWGVIQGH